MKLGALFRPLRPIGARAMGREVGPHRFDYESTGMEEFRALMDNRLDPKLTPALHKVFLGKVVDLMRAAQMGELSFDPGKAEGALVAMGDRLYELRPRLPRGNLCSRELRVYCGEPERVRGQILGFHLATKPRRHTDDAQEQNVAIAESLRRADEWERVRHAG